MPGHKIDRATEDIKRELTAIFRELKDPRISKLLSIVRLEVSGDMSYAKAFVSAIEGQAQTVQSVAGLKAAAGFIRHELGARLSLRKVPELRFVADDSIRHSADIAQKLSRLDIPADEEQT